LIGFIGCCFEVLGDLGICRQLEIFIRFKGKRGAEQKIFSFEKNEKKIDEILLKREVN